MQRESIGRVFFLMLLGFTLYLLVPVLRPLLRGSAWAIVIAVASIALSGLIAFFLFLLEVFRKDLLREPGPRAPASVSQCRA